MEIIFSGLWKFNRYISNPEISIYGTISFDSLPDGLISAQEQGQYNLKGKIINCFQKHFIGIKNSNISIYNNNKQLLHDYPLTTTTPPIHLSHIHKCNADIYHSHLMIINEQLFKLQYKVKGPNKNYTIITDYYR